MTPFSCRLPWEAAVTQEMVWDSQQPPQAVSPELHDPYCWKLNFPLSTTENLDDFVIVM